MLRSSPQLFAMLNRRAAWRKTKASESQRRLVEKRLGLSKSSHSSSGPGEAPTSQLTKGQASVILTRLLHGAKGRWKERVKRSNRVWRQEERERARVRKETVRVGPLASE